MNIIKTNISAIALFFLFFGCNVFADRLVSNYSLLDYKHNNGSTDRYKFQCWRQGIQYQKKKVASIEVMMDSGGSVTFTGRNQHKNFVGGKPLAVRIRYKDSDEFHTFQIANDAPILSTFGSDVFNIVFSDIKINSLGEIRYATVEIKRLSKRFAKKAMRHSSEKQRNLKYYW